MGQSFTIRNLTTGEIVFESSAGIARRLARLGESLPTGTPGAIICNIPLIGFDGSPWYDAETDTAPETGVSGAAAAREMTALIELVEAMPANSEAAHRHRGDRDFLAGLRETFLKTPQAHFAGHLTF